VRGKGEIQKRNACREESETRTVLKRERAQIWSEKNCNKWLHINEEIALSGLAD